MLHDFSCPACPTLTFCTRMPMGDTNDDDLVKIHSSNLQPTPWSGPLRVSKVDSCKFQYSARKGNGWNRRPAHHILHECLGCGCCQPSKILYLLFDIEPQSQWRQRKVQAIHKGFRFMTIDDGDSHNDNKRNEYSSKNVTKEYGIDANVLITTTMRQC